MGSGVSTKMFLIGDIHGNYIPVWNFYRRSRKEISDGDWVIMLGDSGLNYYGGSRDNFVKSNLSDMPLKYFVIRGNHDRRPSTMSCMRKVSLFGGSAYVDDRYPNIYYAEDNVAVYDLNGLKTLVIPGAYSVDKYYRLSMGYNWFKDEQLSAEEREAGLKVCDSIDWKCDVVLSHTCPSIYVPTDLFLSVVDQSTVDTSMERYLGGVEYRLDYKLWLWGHYHAHRVYPVTDGRQRVMLFNEKVMELGELYKGSIKIY